MFFYHYHMMQELSLKEALVNEELQALVEESEERYIQALEQE